MSYNPALGMPVEGQEESSEEQDNQKTSAYGGQYAATQGGTLDKTCNLISGAISGGTELVDCRDKAFKKKVSPLPNWKKGEATGVHAEVLIIRAWLVDLIEKQEGNEVQLETLKNELKGRRIFASQPACWCCARLMEDWGIGYTKAAGSKPLTAWRHPFCAKSVPNDKIPNNQSQITSLWIANTATFK